ncbi:transporter substrate-binding domain-containing protein [Colwelliaceae bacterium 6471]
MSTIKQRMIDTFRLCIICLYFATQWVCAQQTITFAVPNFPPYSYQQNKQVTGEGITLAEQAFAKAKITPNYILLPNYAKVVYQVKENRADGFLLASQNKERDKIAVFSKPLLINRWSWYVLKDSVLTPKQPNFKSQAIVSSHFNSNTHKWLASKGYKVQAAMRLNKLPKMLLTKRVDAVFISERVFKQAVIDEGLNIDLFEQYAEIAKPFGIYISKHYLKLYPDTLTKLNNAIDQLSIDSDKIK